MIVAGEGLVLGEVYRISPAILQKLDILEEHPDYYQRGLVTLQSGRSAFVYWGKSHLVIGFSVIAGGSWRDQFNFHQDFMKNS